LKRKNIYQKSKAERQFLDSIQTDMKAHNSNLKNYQFLKIKQELVEAKANRYKSQLEKEEKIKSIYDKKVQKQLSDKLNLQEMLKDLEQKEMDYINKIKNTVLLRQQEFEDFKTEKLNNSTLDISEKKHKHSSSIDNFRPSTHSTGRKQYYTKK